MVNFRSLSFILFSFFFLVLCSSTSHAVAITGGGNITNLTNQTGGAVNITGAGYYYFVPGGSTGVNINYTNETVETSISIETANVVLDCQYAPQLRQSIIAGARGTVQTSPASNEAGIVVNATRLTGSSMSNVTIQNCIFTNFSRTTSTAIAVVGNVSSLTIYNNTVNDSTLGIVLAGNQTNTGSMSIFAGVNISNNRFYNLTTQAYSHAIYSTPGVGASTLIVSVLNSTIAHNNFTALKSSPILLFNSSNITVFNNTVYNTLTGFEFCGLNNSNISTNNITNIYGSSSIMNPFAIGLFNNTPGLSNFASAPNTIENNWIFNVSVGTGSVTGQAIQFNTSNTNITGNLVNYTQRGITTELNGGSSIPTYFVNLKNNAIGNATDQAVDLRSIGNLTMVGNIFRDSYWCASITTGANYTTSINNTYTNCEYGIVFGDTYNYTSQDDIMSRMNLYTMLPTGDVNATFTNLTASLSNISANIHLAPVTAVNMTFKQPISIQAISSRDSSPLASASVSISSTSGLPAGIGGVLNSTAVLDGTGTAHYNITTYIIVNSSGATLNYNLTPHTLSATLSGYGDASSTVSVPSGVGTAEQAYVLTLTAPHAPSYSDSGSSTTTTTNVEKPTSEVPQEQTPETPTTEASQPQGPHSQSDADRANTTTATVSQNTTAQTNSINLDVPGIGAVQVDPLVAVAVVVVIVLIVFILMGMM